MPRAFVAAARATTARGAQCGNCGRVRAWRSHPPRGLTLLASFASLPRCARSLRSSSGRMLPLAGLADPPAANTVSAPVELPAPQQCCWALPPVEPRHCRFPEQKRTDETWPVAQVQSSLVRCRPSLAEKVGQHRPRLVEIGQPSCQNSCRDLAKSWHHSARIWRVWAAYWLPKPCLETCFEPLGGNVGAR